MFGYEVGFQKGCGPNIYIYEGIVTYSEDLSAAFMLEKHKHIGFVSKKKVIRFRPVSIFFFFLKQEPL